MKYYITVYYNDKGKKLTKQDKYQFHVDYSDDLSEEMMDHIVWNEVPRDLISSYYFDTSMDYSSLVPGDYVSVKCTKTERNGSSSWTEIHEVKSVDNDKIVLYDFEYDFQLNGIAITKKKKDIPVLKIPSKEEIDEYKEQIKKEKLWRELYNFVVAQNENMDDPYDELFCPYYITSSDLEEVLNILRGKNKNDTNY